MGRLQLGWEVALYSCMTGELNILHYNDPLPVSLKILEHEIFTITPIKTLASGFSFAPFGLIDMFNAGGAIENLKYDITGLKALVSMEVKGCGRFGAYSSTKPKRCMVGSFRVEFEFSSASGLVTLYLPEMPPEDKKIHNVQFEF
ncbi:UNVERIFIED_CONTAM: putative galactinol--sucrose galactosyltransferase 6 [Sesamum radiatum]|uniref:Galactinol--sucrose galactosyltransferase 6 n=1 Tax=Sesamum radiatum TaxID=300843 RepID=A0AAW2TGX0_SESRA